MSSTAIRHRLSYAAKCAVTYGLYYSGVLHVWCRFALRRRAVVLTYHRVLPNEVLSQTWSHPGIIVTRKTFERHVRFLTRWFRVLSLREFVAAMEAGTGFKASSCLITFDDGWQDTYSQAWPVLRQHRAPAVVFLPVGYIGSGKMFWQEELGALLHGVWARARRDATFRRDCQMLLLKHSIESILDAPSQTVRDEVRSAVQALKARMRRPDDLLEPLRALVGRWLVGEDAVDAFMDWNQVREMADDGASFGGHGTTHRILTTLRPAEAAEEIHASRRVLERELGPLAIAFSYPNGNWNPMIADAVQRSEYRVSFSTERGYVMPGDARFSLRRINIHDDVARNAPMFLARIVGLF